MYIRVRVFPGAKRERVTKRSETEYEIMVRERAERNQANKRVSTLLQETYGISSGQVRLVTGHRSPTKVFDVDL